MQRVMLTTLFTLRYDLSGLHNLERKVEPTSDAFTGWTDSFMLRLVLNIQHSVTREADPASSRSLPCLDRVVVDVPPLLIRL